MVSYHLENHVSTAVLPWKYPFASLIICFVAGEGLSFLNLSVKVVMIGI